MCRAGGRRCRGSCNPDRAAENARRRAGRAYRNDLCAALDAAGHPELAVLARRSPMSSLPELTRAAGLDPALISDYPLPGESGTHPLTEQDHELLSRVTAECAPTRESLRAAAEKDREDVTRAVEELSEATRRADRLRWAANAAKKRGEPRAIRAANAAHKDAVLDAVVAETARDAAWDRMAQRVSAASRGEQVVGSYTGNVATVSEPDADPASDNIMAALGLTEWTARDGSLKPMYPESIAKAIRNAGPREHDDRMDALALAGVAEASPTLVVEHLGKRIGTPERNTFVDAVVSDHDGAPRAVVLCADAREWVDGKPPVSVRAKALYAAEIAQRPAGVAAVVGGEPRLFVFHPGESLDGQYGGPTISSRMEDIDARREAMRNRKSQGGSGMFRGPIDGKDKYARRDAEENLAGLLHYSHTPEQIRKELDARTARGDDLDTAVRSLLAENFDRTKLGTVAAVDGETAGITNDRRGFDPEYADWIETGVAYSGPDGEPSGEFERRHGADPRIIAVNGTGAQHIHGIAPEDIAGKDRLAEPGEREQVGKALLAGDVLVAHNAFFEKRHLGHVMPGVTEARPWIDTQWLARHFMPAQGCGPERSGLKLQHLVEDQGDEYADAHSALPDAKMTARALEKILSRPGWYHGAPAPDTPGPV